MLELKRETNCSQGNLSREFSHKLKKLHSTETINTLQECEIQPMLAINTPPQRQCLSVGYFYY